MKADEEYGNSVWDKHFGALYSQLQIQKNIYQFSGIINPFAFFDRYIISFSSFPAI